ncbi:RHS repeat-associated core domain-containing protein [Streptomyces flavofungini]|uniref:RHS repeat-associated core domain-containing protein n=1 Tax=Streptomyces flavofungini TaxID=68200 RepID=UPI0025B2694E|nr:RHS repeat-associated core domain-containing protein [Streptomyces flavofungini]WJV45587.1 RHS repeat-associated core domain-containing protein [Streptomyces flavofungini]
MRADGGGTNDPTGLIHLGAREYDPTLGRFLSVDPINDHDDPAQLNAYSYAHNSPLTKSDPDGLRPLGPTDHGPAGDAWWAADHGMYAGYKYKGNGRWIWKQTPRKGKVFRKRYNAYRANPSHYLIDDSHARARARQSAINRAKWQAQARADAEQKRAEEAQRRKKDGIWGNIKKGNLRAAWDNTGGKVVSKAHGFMQENSKTLGWVGVGLGAVSMFTPMGWITTGAMVGGIALGAATTADACASKQWGSCGIGAAILGFAGGAVALTRTSTSLLRSTTRAGFGQQVLRFTVAGGARGVARVADVSSVGFTVIGTTTGGNLGTSNHREDY